MFITLRVIHLSIVCSPTITITISCFRSVINVVVNVLLLHASFTLLKGCRAIKSISLGNNRSTQVIFKNNGIKLLKVSYEGSFCFICASILIGNCRVLWQYCSPFPYISPVVRKYLILLIEKKIYSKHFSCLK